MDTLTSKSTQVTLFDFDQTLHISRALKNNRHVFFYIGGNSVLRVVTILWILGGGEYLGVYSKF